MSCSCKVYRTIIRISMEHQVQDYSGEYIPVRERCSAIGVNAEARLAEHVAVDLFEPAPLVAWSGWGVDSPREISTFGEANRRNNRPRPVSSAGA